MQRHAWRTAALAALLALLPASAPGQVADAGHVTLDRLFSADFRGDRFGPARWLDDGDAYTTLEPREDGPGADLVRFDTETGERSVLVAASRLVPGAGGDPLAIEDYEWSPDGSRLLIFTNTRRVWRRNTRGDYWVYEPATGRLHQLGDGAPEASLMFAKFDPSGTRVAYRREFDLYVEDLRSGEVTRLTDDGSRTIINGTFDWVYEEEFDARDGFRWSPDGRWIAFWQLDAEGIRDFLMINNTDSLYSYTIPVQYPKAGERNSAARVGVVPAAGGDVRWFDVPGDPRDNYIPRMEWAGTSEAIVLQRMNRLQNTNMVMLGDVATGRIATIFTDRDDAWVDAVDDWEFADDGSQFIWVSETDGWRHVYEVSRDGQGVRLITRGNYDVISVELVDLQGGWIWFLASPANATQRYLYRAPIRGDRPVQRITPGGQPGTHGYTIAPNGKYAFHTWSRFGVPPITELVRLPDHQTIRVLVDNADLKATVDSLRRGEAEFFRVDAAGTALDGWMMRPPDFDPARKYPVLMYGYTGPAGQTVMDSWGGFNYLWHLMLTQQGYIVASVDNRGTPAPRGRDFRKVIYRQTSQVASVDQAAALRSLLATRPYMDPDRIGAWGWSGGGTYTLNMLFRYPELYDVGMAVAPVTHEKYYDTIYTERYMGLPEGNPEGYEESAPLTYAKDLEGDLLIVHGTGDDNVHYQNTEALVNELIRHGKSFTMMAYPNRSHGIFEGPGTRKHVFGLLTGYLQEHLPAGGR
ncbi:MAG: S9 family peptidase [Gemmatimonadota bacterium]|nr:S9 family peptidase [Gemmatimonadota bacterium]